MSILDENYEDKLQNEVKWGLDRMRRTNVKVFHCTNTAMLTKYIYMTSNSGYMNTGSQRICSN